MTFNFSEPKMKEKIRKPSRQDPDIVASPPGSQKRGNRQLAREDHIQSSPADAARPVRHVLFTPSPVVFLEEHGVQMRWVH